MKTATPTYLLPGCSCIYLDLHKGTATKIKGILHPFFTILITVQACNILLWSILEENIKYNILTSQPIDFTTKLQSLNTGGVELKRF